MNDCKTKIVVRLGKQYRRIRMSNTRVYRSGELGWLPVGLVTLALLLTVGCQSAAPPTPAPTAPAPPAPPPKPAPSGRASHGPRRYSSDHHSAGCYGSSYYGTPNTGPTGVH